MHAVILAGGRGVRLRPYTTCLPKPLVPMGDDHVLIDVLLAQLVAQGFTSATLAINHFGSLIRAYVGDGDRWGLRVTYAEEVTPLSTVGPLFLVRDELPEHFLVTNADILTTLPFDTLLTEHIASGAPLTIATRPTSTHVEFGVLDVVDGRVRGFTEKPTLSYQVSMGVYGMTRSAIAGYPAGMAYGADDLVLDLISRGEWPGSWPYEGLWMDIGRPADYDDANERWSALLPLLLPSSRPAIAGVA